MNMEGVEGVSAPPPRFTLTPIQTLKEDILFCVDGDAESQVEMKIATGASGRPLTRLDAIKQAILMFVNAKTTIDPNHRFAFCAIGKSVSWVRKEFNNDVDSALSALRSISVNPTGGLADLTHLFRVAAHEAKKSRAQNRLFRVVVITTSSSMACEPKTLHFRCGLPPRQARTRKLPTKSIRRTCGCPGTCK
uniref:BRISC and BRCA1-A complex member 1 n=1 Tax=Kalanchoe fedtschenkoi TaxID=63787 RepID=A0A7N0RHL2_KALFE